VPEDASAAWDRFAADYQRAAGWSCDVAHYGPDLPTERELRLLGDLKGKRVLELGCGGAQCSIAFAKQGAITIGVDFSSEQLAYARRLCQQEEVKVELRLGDLADLAFLTADSIDLVFSAGTFGYIKDLDRVFRQVHRVLKVGAPLVFSVAHPASLQLGERSYWDSSAVPEPRLAGTFSVYPHTFGQLYASLSRASYRLEAFVEPEPTPGGPRSPWWRDSDLDIPSTLIVKARKEGN
jgi:ubiquinone/menaquinone biosynthesis C-methylase UbiE